MNNEIRFSVKLKSTWFGIFSIKYWGSHYSIIFFMETILTNYTLLIHHFWYLQDYIYKGANHSFRILLLRRNYTSRSFFTSVGVLLNRYQNGFCTRHYNHTHFISRVNHYNTHISSWSSLIFPSYTFTIISFTNRLPVHLYINKYIKTFYI